MNLKIFFNLQTIIIMVREIVKVSILLVLLIQFQTDSYNFLDASPDFVRKKSQPVEAKLFFNNDSQIVFVNEENKFKDGETLENFHEDQVIEISTKMDPDRILRFEQILLKLLGMKKRPVRDKDKGELYIPKYLNQLYNNQLERDVPTSNLNLAGRFTKSANTIRSFYHSGNERELEGLHAHFNFDISSVPLNEEITGAELHVPFVLDDNSSTQIIQVLVHDVVKVLKYQNHEVDKNSPKKSIIYPVDTKMVKLSKANSTFWLTFDVFPALSRRNSIKARKNFAVAVEIVNRNQSEIQEANVLNLIRVKRATPNTDSNPKESAPMLLTFSDDGHNLKKTRNAKTLSRNYRSYQNQRKRKNHRQKNRRRNLCSRRKMFVDFTDVGWNDWIVAPPGYQAFYCSGECPFPMAEHLNATNHAVIQALVNSMNPQLIPPPCCVPNKYSSLSMLYTDSSDRIVLKNYNEMIVDSCGCS